jgi:hypothetical protein
MESNNEKMNKYIVYYLPPFIISTTDSFEISINLIGNFTESERMKESNA